MGDGFSGSGEDGEYFEDLSDLQYRVVADAERRDGELLACFFAADQELDERADSGGIEPFEFFEVEDKDLLGLFAQGLIEAGDRLERKTADQRDRFQARA